MNKTYVFFKVTCGESEWPFFFSFALLNLIKMTTVYKYRVYCVTDAIYEYQWGETEPTKCPTNTAHTIDASKTVIVDKNEPELVTVKEELVPTGGHFQITTVTLEATANVTTTVDHSWPIPVTVLGVSFVTKAPHEGDLLDIIVAPDTIVGTLTANISTGNVIANVSQTVIDNVHLGYEVYLWNGIDTHSGGLVLNVDTNAKQIEFQNPTEMDFTITPLTTYVKMSRNYVKDFELGPAWKYEFGSGKIGGSYVPKNRIIRIAYTNLSPVDDKRIVFHVEYLY